MTPFHVLLPLLAQTDRMQTMGERFRGGGNSISIQQVLVGAVLIIAVAVVIWRISRALAVRDGQSYTSPRRLFRELCRLHELDWPSRRLLRQMAKVHQLSQPAILFLQPALFDTRSLAEPLQPFTPQIGALGNRLFARDARHN